ncbi:hypothetical protein P2318_29180 [Myxococcaceae bacterium GXIMD 01537]
MNLKPSTVVLILVLVAVVALYLLGVGLGATDRSASSSQPAVSIEDRQAWRERFLKPRPVEADELKVQAGSPCTLVDQKLNVPLGSPCRVEVTAGGARARTLEVVPQAAFVSMTFTPRGKPALPVKEDSLSDAKKLDVMREGGDLEVSCLRAAAGPTLPCGVQLR